MEIFQKKVIVVLQILKIFIKKTIWTKNAIYTVTETMIGSHNKT